MTKDLKNIIAMDFCIDSELLSNSLFSMQNKPFQGLIQSLKMSLQNIPIFVTEQESQQIEQIAKDIKAGTIKDLKIAITIDKGMPFPKETFSFDSSMGIFFVLKDTLKRTVRVAKRGRGRPEKKGKRDFSILVKMCIDFLEDNSQKQFNKTEKCVFAGLVLSYYGLLITPEEYYKREGFESKDDIIEYKEYIADQVKYYI